MCIARVLVYVGLLYRVLHCTVYYTSTFGTLCKFFWRQLYVCFVTFYWQQLYVGIVISLLINSCRDFSGQVWSLV